VSVRIFNFCINLYKWQILICFTFLVGCSAGTSKVSLSGKPAGTPATPSESLLKLIDSTSTDIYSNNSPYNFGTIGVGSFKVLSFTLKNIGGKTATLATPNDLFPFAFLPPNRPGGNCVVLAPAQTCTINVEFSPDHGNHSATLMINYTDGTNSNIFNFNVEGKGRQPALLTIGNPIPTPAPVSYGSAVSITFPVTNSGELPATEVTIDNSGSNSSAFTNHQGCGNLILSNCDRSVSFQSLGEGLHTYKVKFTYKNGVIDLDGTEHIDSTTLTYSAEGSALVKPILSQSSHPNASKWSHYFTGDLSTECTIGSQSNISDCRHGGELKFFSFLSTESCEDFELIETLGLLNWECIPGSPTVFKSNGIKFGRGLKDIVNWNQSDFLSNGNGFRSNQIEIRRKANNQVVLRSPLTKWWNSDIEFISIPLTATKTPTADTILAIKSNAATSDYGINLFASDKASIVTESTFTASPTDNCNGADGASGGTQECVIFGGGNFLWIEGNYDLQGSTDGVALKNTLFSRFHNLKVFGASAGSGIKLTNSNYNTLDHLHSYSNSKDGS